MTSEIGGPYVQMAVICERALQEKDGVISIIRVVDRFTVTASGIELPIDMPEAALDLTVVIMLKAGFYSGRSNVRVVPNTPSGKKLREVSIGVLLEGEDRGANLILNVRLQAKEEGLYWLDVFFEQQLLTRIPLRLIYQRLSRAQTQEIS